MAAMRILLAWVALLGAGAASADTVLHNITGYTSSFDGIRHFEAMAFSDAGKILAIGDAGVLADFPAARRIDGGARFVLPGLTDAHAHVYDLGFLAVSLNLTGVSSLNDALAETATFAGAHPLLPWIQGYGWNQVLWPARKFPSATDLDGAVADRPVWLSRIDGHAGWANSRALAIAGVDDATPDPPGGRILRDANGHATGVLIDKAMDLVEARLPAPDGARIREILETAVRQLNSLGLTGVHDAGIDVREAEVYLSMAADTDLDLRVYVMLDGSQQVLESFGSPIRNFGNDHLDIAGIKLYADGALGSRGAAMLEPYSDDPENRGLLLSTVDELYQLTRDANRRGYQVGIHAIGDRANRLALDAIEHAQGGRPSPLRNRVEHAQVIAAEDIPRFAKLGVIASMQPTHATSDMNMAEDRVGPDRILGAYAWRRLLASGAILASGSDFPVELPNPFFGLYAAVTRQDRAGLPENGWYPEQRLTRAEALHSFTLAAAYAAHQEDRLGSLEPGKWADFIIVDRDYFKVPASEIDDIRVLETWIGGRRVYSAAAGDSP